MKKTLRFWMTTNPSLSQIQDEDASFSNEFDAVGYPYNEGVSFSWCKNDFTEDSESNDTRCFSASSESSDSKGHSSITSFSHYF